MFIPEIFRALQDSKSIILAGPQGCGKSTVVRGVVFASAGMCVRYEPMSILNVLREQHVNWHETAENTIFVIDGMPQPKQLEKISALCTEVAGLQFIFLTSDSDLLDPLEYGQRFAVINWPKSDLN